MTPQVGRKISLLVGLAFLIGFALPLSTALENVATGLFLIAWLGTGEWYARWLRLRENPATYAIGALLLFATIGMFWSLGDTKETLRYFQKYTALILALALFTLPFDHRMRQKALLGFAIATLVTAIISFAFKLQLIPASWLPGKSPTNPVVFKLHITQGFFVAIGAYILFVRALESRACRSKALFAIGAAITAANVLVIEGRTGYVILAVLLVYLFVQRFRWRGVLASIVLLGVAVLIAQQFPESAAMRRVATGVEEMRNWQLGQRDEYTSMGARLDFAATSLRLISERPLLGAGTGGYAVSYKKAVPDGALLTNNPHNQYLLTAVQLGVPGLGLLLLLFIVLWRLTSRMPHNHCILARGFLLAYVVGNLFNSFLYDHSESHFFAWAVGLIFCGAASSHASQRTRNC